MYSLLPRSGLMPKRGSDGWPSSNTSATMLLHTKTRTGSSGYSLMPDVAATARDTFKRSK